MAVWENEGMYPCGGRIDHDDNDPMKIIQIGRAAIFICDRPLHVVTEGVQGNHKSFLSHSTIIPDKEIKMSVAN